jgi:signal transduction histidine kinase
LALLILGISLSHAGISPGSVPGKIAQYLFFLPIAVAALWFGWKGGLIAAGACALGYLPDLIIPWRDHQYTAEEMGEALDLILVGSIFGILAERERRQTRELERTTHELSRTNRQLQESFEHLKRAERLSAVGQLTANLAHEIRNPLASIEGAAGLLEPGSLPEEQRAEFVGIIRKESRRLSRLLTEMLDFARPKSPAYEAAPLGPLVVSVASLLSVVAQRSGVRFRVEAGGAPVAECDPAQIKQVILNLAMNAIQAMPDGGEVVLEAGSAAGRATIAVLDQGPGVDPAELDRIFSPFYTTKPQGTGLGLSVALQIVERHGGEIRVTANQPRGAIFSVILPLMRLRAEK